MCVREHRCFCLCMRNFLHASLSPGSFSLPLSLLLSFSKACSCEPRGLEGATMPLVDPTSGMDRWDPMRLSAGDSEKFDRYRRAEVKHGRVAMLAVTGLVAQHAFRLPYIITGDEGSPIASLASVPSGFNAISTWPASVGFGLLFTWQASGLLTFAVPGLVGRKKLQDLMPGFQQKKALLAGGFR